MILGAVGFGLGQLQTNFRNRGGVDPISKSVQTAVLPIGAGLKTGLDRNGDFWAGIWSSGSLKVENARLKQLEASWALYSERVSNLEKQLQAARDTMGLPNFGRDRVAGDIIAYDQANARITLNIGSGQGVEPGMAVVAGQGLVGVIQTVDKSRSQALTVSSPTLKVGTLMASADPAVAPLEGIARGRGEGEIVLEIVGPLPVGPMGKRALTSPHSIKIPANIPVGEYVRKESATEYGVTRFILRPYVRLASTREVWVLK